MKSVHLLAAMVAVAAPWAVSATDLSHRYVEGGVARLSEDISAVFGPDAEFDGGYLRGSAAFGATGLYGFGGVRRGGGDAPYQGLDQSRTQLGLGYAHRVAPNVELLGEAGYLRDAFEGYGVDTGRVSAGAHAALGSRVEGWAKAHYTDDTFDSTRYSGEVGALVKFNDTWGVVGEGELGDQRRDYKLGLRASF